MLPFFVLILVVVGCVLAFWRPKRLGWALLFTANFTELLAEIASGEWWWTAFSAVLCLLSLWLIFRGGRRPTDA